MVREVGNQGLDNTPLPAAIPDSNKEVDPLLVLETDISTEWGEDYTKEV